MLFVESYKNKSKLPEDSIIIDTTSRRNQLIFMQSSDKIDADEVNIFFNNMSVKLESSISDEIIINMKRKNNLDKIL